MKKSEQMKMNDEVLEAYADTNKLLREYNAWSVKPLRSCSATVYNVQGVKILRSYDTIVAAIYDGVCYDFLRYAYGYTPTSAQHISKFCKDYGAYKKLTYKGV